MDELKELESANKFRIEYTGTTPVEAFPAPMKLETGFQSPDMRYGERTNTNPHTCKTTSVIMLVIGFLNIMIAGTIAKGK
jgi:hypothetical protein